MMMIKRVKGCSDLVTVRKAKAKAKSTPKKQVHPGVAIECWAMMSFILFSSFAVYDETRNLEKEKYHSDMHALV